MADVVGYYTDVFHLLFKCNKGGNTMHPKFDPTKIRTHDLQIFQPRWRCWATLLYSSVLFVLLHLRVHRKWFVRGDSYHGHILLSVYKIQDGFIAFSCIQLYTYKVLFTYRIDKFISRYDTSKPTRYYSHGPIDIAQCVRSLQDMMNIWHTNIYQVAGSIYTKRFSRLEWTFIASHSIK